MKQIPEMLRTGQIEAPDILCGGTPCQSFSVAGKRKSLSDARGNLALTFCNIADEIDAVRTFHGRKPVLVFWENVPGVLSTPDNAFGCFLSELVGSEFPICAPEGKFSGAGLVIGRKRIAAWRTLDAQYFGTPQRRRRVFLMASDIAGGGQILQRYYLSIKACKGIIRRAKERGKTLPEGLMIALNKIIK
jgi:DNA (cytosine-5)-methyltransferase 1